MDRVVVLNKADLSADGAERIRDLCDELGAELVAEIPFDEALSVAHFEGKDMTALRDSPALEQVRTLWDGLTVKLDLVS